MNRIPLSPADLQETFGPIDIYLFDQLLRGNLRPDISVLDAGCGHGRNLVYLLRAGYRCFGVDRDAAAIEEVRRMAAILSPQLAADNFRAEPIEAMSFPNRSMDAVLVNAVLHFALNDDHFAGMLQGAWRTLKPQGLFFCRTASIIGMEHRRAAGRRFLSPDGEERYCVDEELLLRWTEELGGELVDPLKTTLVQDRRCMTTWVVRKR